jgi:hypothetical protein
LLQFVRSRRSSGLAAAVIIATVLAVASLLAWAPVTLESIDALPAHIAGSFEEALAYQRLPDGTTYVFDRRRHTVYRVDSARSTVKSIVSVGFEEGRILMPSAFDAAPDGTFVVADAPKRKERVQMFNPDGVRVAGFELAGGAAPRIVIGSLVMNGIGSIAFTGKTILINRPETGGLITEYDVYGRAQRTIGALRSTGHEADKELHLALNSAIPLPIPEAHGGGFFLVFLAGEPRFHRYDAAGTKVFERAIQGPELDRLIAQQPTQWPRREIGGTEYPLVLPVIRAARVDPRGHLWISLMLPFSYEYDLEGEKLRTVQFKAAGIVAPSSMFFATNTRLLVTPGLFEFDTSAVAGSRGR